MKLKINAVRKANELMALLDCINDEEFIDEVCMRVGSNDPFEEDAMSTNMVSASKETTSMCDHEYADAIDGDIYLNPLFGDMWIVDGQQFIKINDGLTADLDEPIGWEKVGHVDGVINKKR